MRFIPPAIAAVLVVALVIWFTQAGYPPTVNLNQASVIPLSQSVSVRGESVCTKCTLHLEGPHNKAIRFADATGEVQVLLLRNNPDLRQHTGNFCGGPKKVHVEGETLQEGGIPLLAVSTLEFLE